MRPPPRTVEVRRPLDEPLDGLGNLRETRIALSIPRWRSDAA
jgi:hypothetical protein